MGVELFGDSYITLGIFMAVEEFFDITIQDAEVLNITTIEELVELIKYKQTNELQ